MLDWVQTVGRFKSRRTGIDLAPAIRELLLSLGTRQSSSCCRIAPTPMRASDVYARGVAAWTRDRYEDPFVTPAGSSVDPSATSNRTGWTVGDGVEWAFRTACEEPRSDGLERLRWPGCWACRVDDPWCLGCGSGFKFDVAKQAGTQGLDLRTIRGAERADQEATFEGLAPVTWIALHSFRDHYIDLALE